MSSGGQALEHMGPETNQVERQACDMGAQPESGVPPSSHMDAADLGPEANDLGTQCNQVGAQGESGPAMRARQHAIACHFLLKVLRFGEEAAASSSFPLGFAEMEIDIGKFDQEETSSPGETANIMVNDPDPAKKHFEALRNKRKAETEAASNGSNKRSNLGVPYSNVVSGSSGPRIRNGQHEAPKITGRVDASKTLRTRPTRGNQALQEDRDGAVKLASKAEQEIVRLKEEMVEGKKILKTCQEHLEAEKVDRAKDKKAWDVERREMITTIEGLKV
ncbi:hypothetical protein CCACVL1_20150 [Corchorus capsularis]|uniref:Uncharacterized protein n=1 Tax=Corchorus capsularis TaxID=210143 RepID=A0A1R3HCA9_COCAP|nr:hypothetical protein CCACVL1_20150 [Corchorus capsularis]